MLTKKSPERAVSLKKRIKNMPPQTAYKEEDLSGKKTGGGKEIFRWEKGVGEKKSCVKYFGKKRGKG